MIVVAYGGVPEVGPQDASSVRKDVYMVPVQTPMKDMGSMYAMQCHESTTGKIVRDTVDGQVLAASQVFEEDTFDKSHPGVMQSGF